MMAPNSGSMTISCQGQAPPLLLSKGDGSSHCYYTLYTLHTAHHSGYYSMVS